MNKQPTNQTNKQTTTGSLSGKSRNTACHTCRLMIIQTLADPAT